MFFYLIYDNTNKGYVYKSYDVTQNINLAIHFDTPKQCNDFMTYNKINGEIHKYKCELMGVLS